MGFFYRHNIHPYRECLRRQETLAAYAENINLRIIYQEGYDLEGFIRNVAFRETQRCRFCYHERLTAAAHVAKRGRCDYFTTTLLYSKFQKHDLIRSIGEAIAKSVEVPFYYHDFRQGWQEGVSESKRLNIYRQQYCGCIYSEKERFFPLLSSKRS
jgi:predicted adenine nucleotide alpha hydrolase (AANH) superfamily ATPase